MKLRNKKTGEIVELKLIQVNDKYLVDHEVDFLNGEKLTLKLLANSFDDVKEPLIKDEKIRKAVQAWAEANHVTRVKYDASWNSFRCTDFVIGFDYDFDRHDGLEDEESYTIAELCGEEEE